MTTVAARSPDMPVVQLDIAQATYDENGMQGFYWPVLYADRRKFAEDYIENMRDFFQKLRKTHPEEADIFLTFHSNLFVMIMTAGQASLLRHQLQGRDVNYAPIQQGAWHEPEGHDWVHDGCAFLLRGFSEPGWKKYARAVKYALKGGLITATPWGMRAKPVITGISPLLMQYVEAHEERVWYRPFSTWFYPLSASERGNGDMQPFTDDIVQAFLSAIPDIGGQKIEPVFLAKIGDHIKEMSHYVRLFLHRIGRAPGCVPRIFLAGSMGIIFNAILALAVKKAGGQIIGFDHGWGCNIWSTSTTALTETQLTDQFYTFGEHSAATINDLVEVHNLSGCKTYIKSTVPYAKSEVLVRGEDVRNKGKTLMFVQTLFMGDESGLDPIMPNVVAADWQARLFHKIKDLGYDVVIKPHPDSQTQLPQDFLDRLGIQINNDPFEKAYKEADIIMFDYAFSTTFNVAMLSNKPIIYIHFSDAQYPEDIKPLLERRIELVDGWYDDENRAQIEWSALSAAIEDAGGKNDKAICDAVLPGVVHQGDAE